MNIIKKFEEIRDIPFRLPLSVDETLCNCLWKAIMLKRILTDNWYFSRYRVCEFNRSDLSIPQDILIKHWISISEHVYLEMHMKWLRINLDPTWDKALSSIFTISNWNWWNSTELAVKPIKIYSENESSEIMKSIDEYAIEKDIETNYEFYSDLNDYLDSKRVYYSLVNNK